MKFTVYDAATGDPIRQGEGQKTAFAAQHRPGRVVFEGHFAETHYYDDATGELEELADPTAALEAARATLEVGINSAGTLALSDLPDCTISINGVDYPIGDGEVTITRPPPGFYLVQIRVPRMKLISTILEVTL